MGAEGNSAALSVDEALTTTRAVRKRLDFLTAADREWLLDKTVRKLYPVMRRS